MPCLPGCYRLGPLGLAPGPGPWATPVVRNALTMTRLRWLMSSWSAPRR